MRPIVFLLGALVMVVGCEREKPKSQVDHTATDKPEYQLLLRGPAEVSLDDEITFTVEILAEKIVMAEGDKLEYYLAAYLESPDGKVLQHRLGQRITVRREIERIYLHGEDPLGPLLLGPPTDEYLKGHVFKIKKKIRRDLLDSAQPGQVCNVSFQRIGSFHSSRKFARFRSNTIRVKLK